MVLCYSPMRKIGNRYIAKEKWDRWQKRYDLDEMVNYYASLIIERNEKEYGKRGIITNITA